MMMTNMAQTIVNALDERLEQIVGNVVSPTGRSPSAPRAAAAVAAWQAEAVRQSAGTCKHQ